VKVKTGFITNSSSTSFIVVIPKQTSMSLIHISDYLKLDLRSIQNFLQDQLQKPCTREDLIDALQSGHSEELTELRIEKNILDPFEELVPLNDFVFKLREMGYYEPVYYRNNIPYTVEHRNMSTEDHTLAFQELDEYYEKLEPIAEEVVDEFIEKYGLENLKIVEVADDSKEGSYLEHDWAFASVPHLTISKH